MSNRTGYFFFWPDCHPLGFRAQPWTFLPFAPLDQNSSPSLRAFPLRSASVKCVICSVFPLKFNDTSLWRISSSNCLRSRMMKISLGEVNEDCVNNSLPLKRVWIPDAALRSTNTTGVVYFAERSGFVEDWSGVGGTGKTKTLTLASSPAVKYMKSPPLENW